LSEFAPALALEPETVVVGDAEAGAGVGFLVGVATPRAGEGAAVAAAAAAAFAGGASLTGVGAGAACPELTSWSRVCNLFMPFMYSRDPAVSPSFLEARALAFSCCGNAHKGERR